MARPIPREAPVTSSTFPARGPDIDRQSVISGFRTGGVRLESGRVRPGPQPGQSVIIACFALRGNVRHRLPRRAAARTPLARAVSRTNRAGGRATRPPGSDLRRPESGTPGADQALRLETPVLFDAVPDVSRPHDVAHGAVGQRRPALLIVRVEGIDPCARRGRLG